MARERAVRRATKPGDARSGGRARALVRWARLALRRWFARPPRPAHGSTGRARTSPRPVASEGSREDLRVLERLASEAWRFRALPAGPFSLELASRDPDAVLRAIYAHARRWAPGLDVPLAVPRLRFTLPGASTAGSFSLSEDGWTTIEVCLSLRGSPRALARVLAHEACHHVLGHAGLAVRGDERRNERTTELAMFVLGLGGIALDGEMAMAAMGLRCDPALGYLDHRSMVAAEEAVLRKVAGLSAAGVAESSSAELEARARRLFDGRGQVERMVSGYQRLAPGLSRDEALRRMIDDYERDRR